MTQESSFFEIVFVSFCTGQPTFTFERFRRQPSSRVPIARDVEVLQALAECERTVKTKSRLSRSEYFHPRPVEVDSRNTCMGLVP